MEISNEMWRKAEKLMAADALEAYKKANPNHNPHGKRRAKPYTVPQRSLDLAKAMGENDPDKVAAIMMYRFGSTSSNL